MFDYQEMFHPTREQIIAGYEKAIQKKREEIKVWEEYLQKLKGQTTLTGVENVSRCDR